jgi:hypothetical protein
MLPEEADPGDDRAERISQVMTDNGDQALLDSG